MIENWFPIDFVALNHYTEKDIAEIFFTSLKDKGILKSYRYNVG